MTHQEFDLMIEEMVKEWPDPAVNMAQLWCQVLEVLDDMVSMNEMESAEARAHAQRYGEAIKEMVLLGAESPSKVYH